MTQKKVIVAQSGGPSPVINNSLRGVLEGCRAYPDIFGQVLGGKHGILGILREELFDLSAEKEEEISLLRNTPASGAIGTCRYKLREEQQEDFKRIVDVIRAHDVGYFFYIGGNDSMDTAWKVAELAHRGGNDLISVGVLKTIDNDVGDPEFQLVDHTPGYGSAARYWALNIQNLNQENRGSATSDPVMVVQVMGRRIGFLPAAARLGDPQREFPLQICIPESKLTLDELTDRIADQVREVGRSIVVLSEGFHVGEIDRVRDAFGHTKFSASSTTAQQVVVNHLNAVGLPARGSARGQIAGTDQRATTAYASTVDLDEAYRVGWNATTIARETGGGFMSTILRRPGPVYRVDYGKVPLREVANSERPFPQGWIASTKTDVTDDFVEYARPLIGADWASVPLEGGIQRFARLERRLVPPRLKTYTPQAYRS